VKEKGTSSEEKRYKPEEEISGGKRPLRLEEKRDYSRKKTVGEESTNTSPEGEKCSALLRKRKGNLQRKDTVLLGETCSFLSIKEKDHAPFKKKERTQALFKGVRGKPALY